MKVPSLVFSRFRQVYDRLAASAHDATELDESFKNPAIPEAQRAIVEKQLAEMRAGHPPLPFSAFAQALNALPGSEPLSLLEVGCASGYYLEVLQTMVPRAFHYRGADYSAAMLALARKLYPGVPFVAADAKRLPFVDAACDVVLAGAMLVHISDWQVALSELMRICKGHLLLHRTDVTMDKPTYRTSLQGYGVLLNRTYINETELLERLGNAGLRLLSRQPLDTGSASEGEVTYLFQRN